MCPSASALLSERVQIRNIHRNQAILPYKSYKYHKYHRKTLDVEKIAMYFFLDIEEGFDTLFTNLRTRNKVTITALRSINEMLVTRKWAQIRYE